MRYQSQFPPSGDGGYEEVLRARQVATAAKRWIVARATNDHFHRLATVATNRSCANAGSHRGQALDRSDCRLIETQLKDRAVMKARFANLCMTPTWTPKSGYTPRICRADSMEWQEVTDFAQPISYCGLRSFLHALPIASAAMIASATMSGRTSNGSL